MSLMDAFLLEEYDDPRQLWITQRADGRAGSGTVNDAADGGVRAEAALFPSSISFDINRVLVVTAFDHGYITDQSVSINATSTQSGVNGRAPYFGQSVVITKVSNRAFTYKIGTDASTAPESAPDSLFLAYLGAFSDNKKAHVFWPVAKVNLANHGLRELEAIQVQGTSAAEYEGSSVVLAVDQNLDDFYYLLVGGTLPSVLSTSGTIRKLTFRFDQWMASAPALSITRLGVAPPTNPFRSRGLAPLHAKDPAALSDLFCGFQVKNGQNIVGSGIDTTTVQLSHVTDRINSTGIFGLFAEMDSGIMISDLTADSNMAGQLIPASQAKYGLTPPPPPGPPPPPPPPVLAPVPGFAPISVQGSYTLRGSHSRARRMRFINFGTQSYPEAFVFTFNAGVLPRTNNVIEDCVVEKPGENNFHETTVLTSIGSGGANPVEQGVRASGTACVQRKNYLNLAFADGVSNELLQVLSIDDKPSLKTTDGTYGQFKLKLRWDPKASYGRSLAKGNNVALYLVQTSAGDPHPYYRGSFPILLVATDVSGGFVTLTCRIFNPPPLEDWVAVGAPPAGVGLVGINFHGLEPFFGSGGVAEQNAVYQCSDTTYADTTGSTRDACIRYNYWSDVFLGINMNFSDPFAQNATLVESVVRAMDSGDPYLVKVTTSQVHYLLPGDAVQILNVRDLGGALSLVYNNNFYVADRPTSAAEDPKVFYYRVYTVPSVDPDPAPPTQPTYGVLKMTRRLVTESNAIDLLRVTPYTRPVAAGSVGFVGSTNPVGKAFKGLSQFTGWVFRENAIRHKDALPTQVVATPSYALRMLTLGNITVDANLVDVGSPYAFQYLKPFAAIRTFNNTKMSGFRVSGADFSTIPPKWKDDTLTAIEDAMSLCF